MITGFNSAAKFKNMTYHVQTEDRGKKVARIDTIIYKSGGAIVHRKQIFYHDILGFECVDRVIRELMEALHQKTIREVEKGLWTLDSQSVPENSFRDVLMKYLLEPNSVTGLNRV